MTELIDAGEGDAIEFKSTLRTNLRTGQHDDKMQLAVLKTIVGFLNARGGTLLIGVSDNGEIQGPEADGFPNEDKMGLHLVNLMKDRVGEVFMHYVHYRFEDDEGGRVLAVRCDKDPKAAFVRDAAAQRFYVRGGASTQELQGCVAPGILQTALWVVGRRLLYQSATPSGRIWPSASSFAF